MKKPLLPLLLLIIISPVITHSDISKAFPDMRDVFNEVSFLDENGNMKKFQNHKDKVLLVFFGYTHCPDVCPTTVLDMARVLKDLGSQADEVLPIFVSVDYLRDDHKKVREYVDFFDSRIAALTSNKDNIDAMTDFFKTRYEFVEPITESYIVEHSSNLYILDKKLQVRKIIPNGIPSSEITKMVKSFL
tara:strand:- start:663 stop:1229 length:567 start_codon:yes stop_codon:yes gene_type:complete